MQERPDPPPFPRSILLSGIAALLFALLFSGSLPAKEPEVVFKDNVGKTLCSFSVELARTPDEQEKGLMFRKTLGKDKGMLFIDSEDRIRTFWMRNTLIPLDLIFIDGTRKVVDLFSGAKPLDESLIVSRSAARYVLEINAGLARPCGITPGITVQFRGMPH